MTYFAINNVIEKIKQNKSQNQKFSIFQLYHFIILIQFWDSPSLLLLKHS